MRESTKPRKVTGIFLVVFLALSLRAAGSAEAFEIGAVYSIGNLDFPQNRTAEETSFDGLTFPMSFSIFGSHTLMDNIDIAMDFTWNDRILRNHVSTVFTFRESFFSIGAGPFFGILNSSGTLVKPGIYSGIRVDWPGIVFASLSAGSSIGGNLVQTGDFIQEKSQIAFGFYVFNAICSLKVINEKFTIKSSENEDTVDSLTIYAFDTDIFQEDVPYNVLIRFAYYHMGKSFIQTASTIKHTLNSLVVGTDIEIDIFPSFTLMTGVESSVYSFGQDALTGVSNPGPASFLFRATAGVKFNI